MKRILIFSLAYYPHVGGAEVAVKEITDRIPDIEFEMITLRMGGEPRRERIGNILVHRVGSGNSYFAKILYIPRAVALARSLHRTKPFDAFWAMMSYMLFPIVLLRMLGVRIPYVLTLQEGDPFEHVFNRLRILPFRPLLRAGFRHAAQVQAISTYLGAWAKRAGYTGDPIIIGNGVDIDKFTRPYTSQELDELSRALGRREGDIFLITTSRLVPKNACDDVIRALPLLPANVIFLILGTGPDEAALRALAADLKVADRVRFLGFVSHDEMPKYLHIADIFIRPSRSEGMGNSFIEAIAAGLPVIATQEGGIADFLFDEKRNPGKEPTGWAVDKDSPEQIAAAIDDILAHPERVFRARENGKRMVAERYEWNRIAQQMEYVFEALF